MRPPFDRSKPRSDASLAIVDVDQLKKELPTLALTSNDRCSISAYDSTDDPAESISGAQSLATELASCGDACDKARRQFIARSLAVAKSQEQVLEIEQADALSRHDHMQVLTINKVLARLSKKLEWLVHESRIENGKGSPATVIGISAESINFGPRKR
jgi:hypothetical protein